MRLDNELTREVLCNLRLLNEIMASFVDASYIGAETTRKLKELNQKIISEIHSSHKAGPENPKAR